MGGGEVVRVVTGKWDEVVKMVMEIEDGAVDGMR